MRGSEEIKRVRGGVQIGEEYNKGGLSVMGSASEGRSANWEKSENEGGLSVMGSVSEGRSEIES